MSLFSCMIFCMIFRPGSAFEDYLFSRTKCIFFILTSRLACTEFRRRVATSTSPDRKNIDSNQILENLLFLGLEIKYDDLAIFILLAFQLHDHFSGVRCSVQLYIVVINRARLFLISTSLKTCIFYIKQFMFKVLIKLADSVNKKRQRSLLS